MKDSHSFDWGSNPHSSILLSCRARSFARPAVLHLPMALSRCRLPPHPGRAALEPHRRRRPIRPRQAALRPPSEMNREERSFKYGVCTHHAVGTGGGAGFIFTPPALLITHDTARTDPLERGGTGGADARVLRDACIRFAPARRPHRPRRYSSRRAPPHRPIPSRPAAPVAARSRTVREKKSREFIPMVV